MRRANAQRAPGRDHLWAPTLTRLGTLGVSGQGLGRPAPGDQTMSADIGPVVPDAFRTPCSGAPNIHSQVQTALEVRQLLPVRHTSAPSSLLLPAQRAFKHVPSGTLSASQNAQLLGSVHLQSNPIRISILSSSHPPLQGRIPPLPSTQHEGRSRHIVGLRARLLRRS